MVTPGDRYLIDQAIASMRLNVRGLYPALERTLREAGPECIRDFARLMKVWEESRSASSQKG